MTTSSNAPLKWTRQCAGYYQANAQPGFHFEASTVEFHTEGAETGGWVLFLKCTLNENEPGFSSHHAQCGYCNHFTTFAECKQAALAALRA